MTENCANAGGEMLTDHVLRCTVWEKNRPTRNMQHDKNTWQLARWAKEHEYFGILPKYYPVRWVNLRIGNIDRRKQQICYVCKTSYPSEEALRNHARRDHGNHKEVGQREVKNAKYGTETGNTCRTCRTEYMS